MLYYKNSSFHSAWKLKNLRHIFSSCFENMRAYRIYSCLQHRGVRRICSSFTLFSRIHEYDPSSKPGLYAILGAINATCISPKPTSCFASITAFRHLHATSSIHNHDGADASDESNGEVEPIDSWEEEDEAEPEVGDGGGVVLNNCPWGEKALSIAQEVLREFSEEMQLYAFKTSPRGYIYVRLDKLSNEYGCPSMDEIEAFSRQYKISLDEEIPDDLALEVSSPGADRLLRVPDDLLRFKDMAMIVNYLEDSDTRSPEKEVVYLLDSIETESKCCVWKLADVRENRDPAAKGRPMSRKQRDCRLKLPYHVIKQVKLYMGF
ncbi:uncharacterized protein LOC121794904 isoform X2 [Salvia splendens]|uniref:uncharacterized protein LOC121794904 isoform X2 n=1 Tax=Salvia splendens TaxID=180675 RepID=UPI001C25C6A0|nr:uncharacterized protein LOC121794904 isoform X2 [Salvia splendens]